jgi:site-specific recombinase XerD
VAHHAGAAAADRARCEHIGPRAHAFGVGALRAHVPLNLLQRWLGHARISTTAIYAAASGPEEFAIAQRFWTGLAPVEPATK